MTTSTIRLDLETEAASAVERVAESIEAELRWLDNLAEQAPDDARGEFNGYRSHLLASLRSLRGGL
ncbi:hypothetical protein N9C85_01575 [Synechococcus sp. AH-224-I15]|nr:hypothetical protein [Synechococcus sp. AH-224-I15]